METYTGCAPPTMSAALCMPAASLSSGCDHEGLSAVMYHVYLQLHYASCLVQKASEEPAAAQDEHMHSPVTCEPREQSSTDLRPAHWQHACAAQYLVMDAQAAAAQQQWNRAEEQLSKVSV